MREKVHQLYLDFLEIAETKRRWNIFNDIPWERFDSVQPIEAVTRAIEVYCTEEMYVPDYSGEGLRLLRADPEMVGFQIRWAYEESRHGLVFREYLKRSGMRSEADVAALETPVANRAWTLPFDTFRRMSCYGALQEAATYTAYKAQKDRALASGDQVAAAIFHHVGSDEAAHAAFYRSLIKLDLEQDRQGTIADLGHVLANFKMPGDGLIPDYHQRLESSGGGLSARAFVQKVILPTLTSLRISRAELKLEARRQPADESPPRDPSDAAIEQD